MKLVKIKFNYGKNEAFALKNRDKYIPVFIEGDIVAEYKNVTEEIEMDLDIFGRLVTK